ncbi:hypothetical protein RUND412_003660 [Rhizina undulata]
MPDLPGPPRSGMSGLYANLLESSTTSSPASISRAPIVFKQSTGTSETSAGETKTSGEDAVSSAQKKLNAETAALRFQPTKRPVQAQPNAKGKPKISMKPVGASSLNSAASTTTTMPAATVAGTGNVPSEAPTIARPITKTTLEDWTGDDDDVNGFYASNKDSARRGGRKKRKKNRDTPPPPTNWDDFYDPSRPNSYEEYRDGDEKIREMEEWREKLFGKRRREDSYESEEEDRYRGGMGNRFAPPPNYSFAPPPQLQHSSTENSPPPPPPQDYTNVPPLAPVVEVPDDVSGEDAYARRMRMSQQGQSGYAAISTQPPPPPPAPTFVPSRASPSPPQPESSATISRAPVRYSLPAAPPDQELTNDISEPTENTEQEQTSEQRSLRPGQKDFARRLMNKYGWEAGVGLGADNSGITQPLRMVANKDKKLSGTGKIIDKNKRKDEDGKFGKMSEVVVLGRMVDGLEDEDEAGLVQEIGEECQEKYGTVERVLIRWGAQAGEPSRVFVAFTSQLSALRAVNALEGRLFNGNTIEARFFSKDKFEERNFD